TPTGTPKHPLRVFFLFKPKGLVCNFAVSKDAIAIRRMVSFGLITYKSTEWILYRFADFIHALP
ncbi:MAG: hypothetical protein J6A63_04270, partial [Clostridia bacterium]|nr:hypothetical protein [Clostridia bacterium]